MLQKTNLSNRLTALFLSLSFQWKKCHCSLFCYFQHRNSPLSMTIFFSNSQNSLQNINVWFLIGTYLNSFLIFLLFIYKWTPSQTHINTLSQTHIHFLFLFLFQPPKIPQLTVKTTFWEGCFVSTLLYFLPPFNVLKCYILPSLSVALHHPSLHLPTVIYPRPNI